MNLWAWFYCIACETITQAVYHGYTDCWQAVSCSDSCQHTWQGRDNPNKVK